MAPPPTKSAIEPIPPGPTPRSRVDRGLVPRPRGGHRPRSAARGEDSGGIGERDGGQPTATTTKVLLHPGLKQHLQGNCGLGRVEADRFLLVSRAALDTNRKHSTARLRRRVPLQLSDRCSTGRGALRWDARSGGRRAPGCWGCASRLAVACRQGCRSRAVTEWLGFGQKVCSAVGNSPVRTSSA